MPRSTAAASGQSAGTTRSRLEPGSGLGQCLRGPLHRLARPPLQPGDGRLAQDAELHQALRHGAHRVAGVPGLLLVLVAVAEGAALHRPVLVEVAVGEGFDQYRPVARLDPGPGPLHGLAHRHHVHAVDLDRGHREPLSPRAEPRLARGLGDVGGDAVEVVLDEEDDGQVVEGGHVEGFVGRAVLHRAVAEEGDGEVAALPQLLGQRVAHRLRRVAADDGVGAEHAGLVPAHVHGAAAPAAIAWREPHDLGHGAAHHLLHRLGPAATERVVAERHRVVEELGEELVVGAVGGVDLVVVGQRRHGADRATLLADAGRAPARARSPP